MGGILSAFFVEAAIIAWRGFQGKEAEPIKAPLPADFLGAVVIFGLLSLAGRTRAETPAAVAAWGLVVATLLNLWTPKTGLPKVASKSTSTNTSKG